MFQTFRLFAAIAVLCSTLGASFAAEPGRTPVRIIVGYPPGNLTDTVARMVAQRLGDRWDRPFIVENRPGAGSSLAPRLVAGSAADGDTLLVTGQAAIIANPHMYENLGYQPFKDFDYVSNLIWTPYVCSVSPALGVDTLAELVVYGKANPGKLMYGSPGVGTTSHMIMEELRSQLGLDLTHVPYKGSSGVLGDLAAGLIQVACEPPPATATFAQAGRIHPVAVTGGKPLGSFPDLPRVAELAPGFDMGAWVGMLSPAGTPPELVQRLNEDIRVVMQDPAIVRQLASQDVDVVASTPQAFRQQAQKDSAVYGDIIKRLGIRMQ